MSLRRPPSSATRWVVGVAVLAALAATVGWAVAGPDSAAPQHSATGSTQPAPPTEPTQPRASTAKPGEADHATPAASQVDAERPRGVVLPSGTAMPVDASATGPDGGLMVPVDIDRAGWWDGSSRLGDPFGSIVIAAHVDSFAQGLGRFVELLEMRPGDVVHLASTGLARDYRVVSARLMPKEAVNSASPLYSPEGQPRLVLITCGGTYDSANGGYQDNMVVVAVPSGPLDKTD